MITSENFTNEWEFINILIIQQSCDFCTSLIHMIYTYFSYKKTIFCLSLNFLKKMLEVTGFGIWGVRSHVHASAHAWNIGDVQKKACFVWLRKLQDVWQIALLKQQRSLSFTFYKTQRSYKNIMCIYLLFHWLSDKNCIIRSSDRRCSI